MYKDSDIFVKISRGTFLNIRNLEKGNIAGFSLYPSLGAFLSENVLTEDDEGEDENDPQARKNGGIKISTDSIDQSKAVGYAIVYNLLF